MSSSTIRLLILVYAAVVLAVTLVLAAGPDGWLGDYNPIEAAPKLFDLAAEDNLVLGTVVDFMGLTAIVLVALLAQLPKERRWGPRTWVFLPIYLYIPSFGIVVWLLWVYPENRFFGRPLDADGAR
jgi:hypothetical protein